MIVTKIIDLLASAAASVFDALPTITLPPSYTTVTDVFSKVPETMLALSSWIPVTTISLVFAAWLTMLGVSIGIRISRIVLSLFTGGGGSVA